MTVRSPFVLGLGEVLWDMLPAGKQCGGAPANVIYHLTHLGTPGAVVSAVGSDAPGDELLQFLRTKGVDTAFITRNGFPTGKVNVTLQNGIPAYDICEPAAWDAIAMTETLKKRLPEASAVIWGTLAQRAPESRRTLRNILQKVPADCLKCFDINLRQHYFDREIIAGSLAAADVLKINDEEIPVTADLLGINGSQEEIIRHLYVKYCLRTVICTLGAEGSLLYDGSSFSHYPVKPCKVVDTVGCGDAFLAGWCHAVQHGGSARDGMTAGTELAARVAAQAGAMGE